MQIIKIESSYPENKALLDMLDMRCLPYDCVEKKTGDWWVATENDECIGFIGGKFQYGFYRLLRIGLLTKTRKKGYGKRLIRCLLRHARKQGYDEVRTYTCVYNHNSMNSLINCGFRSYETYRQDDNVFIRWKCQL